MNEAMIAALKSAQKTVIAWLIEEDIGFEYSSPDESIFIDRHTNWDVTLQDIQKVLTIVGMPYENVWYAIYDSELSVRLHADEDSFRIEFAFPKDD